MNANSAAWLTPREGRRIPATQRCRTIVRVRPHSGIPAVGFGSRTRRSHFSDWRLARSDAFFYQKSEWRSPGIIKWKAAALIIARLEFCCSVFSFPAGKGELHPLPP